ncbi:uncharacterized protein [Elaeis guineensis]|uniref:Uncharacterized protein LOC105033759 n=1 Tax=Elaeis guineensis var. tenera TaxID=51953 RepID=A0A6I9QDP6_ELAGV|nr:uncharacterized protein LOC105033759 [Elaeis guineensis]
MPQLDLEKFVCVGNRKVFCETLVDVAGGGEPRQNPPLAAVEDPDNLAGSFEREIGWADRNAVYGRNDSTTGSTNPKSSNARRGSAASNSQLVSTNLKANTPIIGLPGKIQHSGFDGRNARRPPRIRIFPKKKARRAEGGGRGKSAVPESEPGSPKVSCFGKVLSDRERERRRREGLRAAEGEWEGWRCSAGFGAIFRCGGGGQTAEEEAERKITVPPRNIPALAASVPESLADAPVLGEMKRFVSGRRAASWGAEAEAEAEAEAGAGGKTVRVGVWGRRSVGSVGDGE